MTPRGNEAPQPQSGGFLIREPKVQKLRWHRAS